MSKRHKPMVLGYMNVYRSGHWHSGGKAGAYDRHAGDIYATPDAAKAAIDPIDHYIATVPVAWREDKMPGVNQ